MVTSRPCFSKKPRSRAIGRPTWSMPVTMPALSFTMVCAAAMPGKASIPHSASAISFLTSSSFF